MFQQDSDILSTCFSSLIVELESKELWALFFVLAQPSHPPQPPVAVQNYSWSLSLRLPLQPRRRGRCSLVKGVWTPAPMEQYCRAWLVHHCCLPGCALWWTPPSTLHSVVWIFFQTQKRYFQRKEEFVNYCHSAGAFHWCKNGVSEYSF